MTVDNESELHKIKKLHPSAKVIKIFRLSLFSSIFSYNLI